LSHLRVESTDPAKWSEYAVSVLGMMPGESGGGRWTFRADERAARLIVSEGAEDRIAGIGWEARGRERWEELNGRLDKAGIEVERLSKEGAREISAAQAVRFTDPAGFPIELVLSPFTEPVRPFVSPTGARFVTEDQGFGHVTLLASHYDEIVHFYTEVLGFHVRETIDLAIQATFASCNPRQHAVAILDGKGTSHFDHLMLEVDEIDVMGRALDSVLDGAAPLIVGLGRHWNDLMISFYMQTPTGFLIEYGYGGRRVEVPDTWTEVQQAGVGGASRWGHRPTELAPKYY
jgi:3,4-dihydroxy-9,10-secoandrosta-1,3,5(10)-triene-9,17-dione 4,5-dioxygenase